MSELSNEALRTHERLTNDFIYFAKQCLRIRNKAGEIVPFELNPAQLYIHNEIEKQKRETKEIIKNINYKINPIYINQN